MFLGIFVLVSFIVGSIGKFFIYDHIKGFKIKDRPINVLIIVNETIYHSLITFTTFNLLIVLLADQTPVKFFEEVFSMQQVVEEVTIANCELYGSIRYHFLVILKQATFVIRGRGICGLGAI